MIAWSFEALAASAALMLVVLAIRMPVARYFGPHIAYGLWALPALRLILPPLPEEVAPAPLATLPSTIEFEWLLAAPARADAAASGVDWALLLATLWIVGAAVFLAWHLLSYRHFVGKALADATQLPRFDRDGIEVCASPAAQGPFAAGIFLKKIVLPEDYRSRYEADELRLALEHEVQHHRRCDISANLIALVVLAFHWWNPIAYFAHRAFRVEQELACDAAVLAQATAAERHAYGAALLKSACDRLPVAACALGAGDDLKRRLRMMKTYRFSPSRARMGGLLAAGLVGGGLMLTASDGLPAETSPRLAPPPPTAPGPGRVGLRGCRGRWRCDPPPGSGGARPRAAPHPRRDRACARPGAWLRPRLRIVRRRRRSGGAALSWLERAGPARAAAHGDRLAGACPRRGAPHRPHAHAARGTPTGARSYRPPARSAAEIATARCAPRAASAARS